VRTSRTPFIIGAIAVVIGGYLYFFEHDTFMVLWRAGWRIILALVGAVFVGLGGYTIWTGTIKGQNDGNSAPVDNPGDLGNRGAGLILGLVQAGLGLALIGWVLGQAQ
jgi:hypothetical protein